MEDALGALEQRIAELRRELREARARRDTVRAGALRAALRDAERRWGARLAPPPADTIRAQVRQGLTLLGVPAAPKLVAAVHRAFYRSTLATGRMSSLRRDEERSFVSSASPRPYYICPALDAELLVPARGLLTVSTWPADKRIVGPLSARVDLLTAAARLARAATDPHSIPHDPPAAATLLLRLARTIPGAPREFSDPEGDAEAVHAAAQAELALHATRDTATRRAAARRAQRTLDATGLLFGNHDKDAH